MRPPGEPRRENLETGYELPGMARNNPLPSIWKIREAQALLDAVNAPSLEPEDPAQRADEQLWDERQAGMAARWRKGLAESLDRGGFASVAELLAWCDDCGGAGDDHNLEIEH